MAYRAGLPAAALLVGCGGTTPPPAPAPAEPGEQSQLDLEADIEIEGRTLHVHCSGYGSPTVVLETGLGVPADSPAGWSNVQPGLAGKTRVCSYDRAGLGQSPAVEGKRSCQDLAADLHAVIEGAAITPPFVFVGHSLGGFIGRFYNQRWPGDIAGVVMVDVAHEDLHAAMRGMLTEEQRAWMDHQLDQAPEKVDLGKCAADAPATGDFGDRPLVYIVATKPEEPPPDLPVGEALRALSARKLELSAGIARLSTQATLVRADRSGHMVMISEPRLVIDAVGQVVDAVRAAPAPAPARP
jgi:pimeloyl-ACP methyl ester carboxylesterase